MRKDHSLYDGISTLTDGTHNSFKINSHAI